MELQIPKGTRDFLPEDKILRDKVVSILKEIFELYGYNPLETPALENFETLSSKYAGGAEIMKEVYKLKDNGGRDLGLRYDLTVPFARVIAMNPELRKPFKRYQIDRVWRDGPMKLGRYREFWQCDVDVVGIKSVMAEAELFALASEAFEKLELDVTIYFNSRKLMNSILNYSRVNKEKQEDTILAIDKLKKIGVDGVRKELEEKGIDDESISRLISLFNNQDNNDFNLIETLESLINDKEGINDIKEIIGCMGLFGVKNAKLDISLARGLSYYTGTVFEIYLNNKSVSSSLAAGGRYDKMIGNFLGSKEDIPAVGISFGLDVITDALKLNKKTETKKSVVDVYIIPMKTEGECIKICQKIRTLGINCGMDFNSKGVGKNLDYANKLGIPYVIIVGEDELKQKMIKLKNMKSGNEKMIKISEVRKEIKLK